MNAVKNFFIFWLPVILYASVIFYLSNLPNVSPNLGKVWDIIITNIAHFVEYFILSVLFSRAMSHTTSLSKVYMGGITVISCTLYAISDEIHQSFVPARTASIWDLLIDVAGIVLGAYFFYKFSIHNSGRV